MALFGSSRNLLILFEAGQGSESLYVRFEVGQDSAELLGRFEAQDTAELLGKFEAQDTAELLGKAIIRHSDIAELLGKAVITRSTELLCNAIIENIGLAVLYAGTEVGQDSGNLFAKFEAQDTQVLYAKSVVRQTDLHDLYARAEVGHGSGELFAKAEVGQGSVELLCRGIVRGAASSDLKGIVDIMHSIDLLGKAVIWHPAFPIWLKAKFSIRLTNAYRDLESIIRLRHDGAPLELFGKFEAQPTTELLGKGIIRHSDIAEFLGKAVIRNVGTPVELLGNAIIRGLNSADLEASVEIRPMTKDSDTYFSFWDPSDWINEVVGLGQGFITIPWVEADTVVKTCGTSSARLTSIYAPNQYKEIRFGWSGTNWGVEAAVPPEVAPTPIDTDGRARAGADRRRAPRAHKDLPAGFFVRRQGFNDLKAQFYVDMAILPGGLWDYQIVWQTGAVLEIGVLQGQIEIDPATGAITARTRHAINDRTIVTMCGGYRAYSKGTFTFDAEASASGGADPVYTPAFGLVENKYDWFAGGGGAHAAMLYYGGFPVGWYFYTEDDGDTESTLISGIDFTAQHTYRIIWEDATEFSGGRVRLWIDGESKATHTVAVPTTPLLFFLLMNTDIVAYSEDDVWTKLHSFSVTGDT